MIDGQEFFSAVQLAQQLNRGAPTIYRWMQIGIRGIVLEWIQLGNLRLVSRAMLATFIERTTAQARGQAQPVAVRSPAQRRKALEAADRTLDRLGV